MFEKETAETDANSMPISIFRSMAYTWQSSGDINLPDFTAWLQFIVDELTPKLPCVINF